jgi:hypothetical protein
MSSRGESIRLGVILGVLLAIRLLIDGFNDPRFGSSVTFRQVFLWGTVPFLVAGLVVYGAIVGWLADRVFASSSTRRVDTSTRSNITRGVGASVVSYFASVVVVNSVGLAVASEASSTGSGPTEAQRMMHVGIAGVGLCLGGAVALWIGGRRDLRDPCIVGLFQMFVGIHGLWDLDPMWFRIALISLPVPGALAGGYVALVSGRSRHRDSPTAPGVSI